MICYILQALILKENWCGNSYLSPKAEKEMKKEYNIIHLQKYDIDLDCELKEKVLKFLDI